MSKTPAPTPSSMLAEAGYLANAVGEKLMAVVAARRQAEHDASELAQKEATLRREAGKPAILEAVAAFRSADLDAGEARTRLETALADLLPLLERLRKAEGDAAQAHHRAARLRMEAGLSHDELAIPPRPVRLDFGSGPLAALGSLVRQSKRLQGLFRR